MLTDRFSTLGPIERIYKRTILRPPTTCPSPPVSVPPSSFHPVVEHPTPLRVFDFTEAYDAAHIRDVEWGVGRYDERRTQAMYNSALYDDGRSVHMGIDIWGPVGTPVHAVADGHVYAVQRHEGPRNYGPTIITEHTVPVDGLSSDRFWVLHGHLSVASLRLHAPGDRIQAGDVLGGFGHEEVNGGWAPHLHLQISIVEPTDGDMPGVVHATDREAALHTFPDPRLLLGEIY